MHFSNYGDDVLVAYGSYCYFYTYIPSICFGSVTTSIMVNAMMIIIGF